MLQLFHILIKVTLILEYITKGVIIPLFYFTFEMLKLLLKLKHFCALRRGGIVPLCFYQVVGIWIRQPESLKVKWFAR